VSSEVEERVEQGELDKYWCWEKVLGVCCHCL